MAKEFYKTIQTADFSQEDFNAFSKMTPEEKQAMAISKVKLFEKADPQKWTNKFNEVKK